MNTFRPQRSRAPPVSYLEEESQRMALRLIMENNKTCLSVQSCTPPLPDDVASGDSDSDSKIGGIVLHKKADSTRLFEPHIVVFAATPPSLPPPWSTP